jgi:hypothetical protein
MAEKNVPRWDTRTVIGLAILLFGLLLFLRNVDYELARRAWQYWPVILIILGLTIIIQPAENRQILTGSIIIIVGLLLLLSNLELIRLRFHDLWPIVLVLVGLSIITRSLRGPGRGGLGSEYINISVLLGGGDFHFSTKNLKGGRITAILGGGKIDLRDADLTQDEVIIDTLAILGGIEIWVPVGWQVAIQGTPLLGGMENKTMTRTGESTPAERPRNLIIKGMAILGGVEVKN